MPYIKPQRRELLKPKLQELVKQLQALAHEDARDLDGDLNYTIGNLLLDVLDLIENPKYSKFNTAIGVLESVKLEMYRRFVAEYEDIKIKENGDIK
jgi:Domain of unknown function (DUF6899)